VWCGCSVRLGIRSGLGIACEGNVRWTDDTSLSDPLLGCEIYLFSFFWETFELHRAEFLPCSAQFKDSLRSPCLSSPFLSTAVLVAGEGWSLSLVFRLECQLQSQCLYSVLPTLLDWESVLFVSCPLMSWP
jgi:hypothetical protein